MKYPCPMLTAVCNDFIDRNATELLPSVPVQDISLECMMNVVGRDTLAASEVVVYKFAEKWIQSHPNVNNTRLLALIRLENMTAEEILNAILSAALFNPKDIYEINK